MMEEQNSSTIIRNHIINDVLSASTLEQALRKVLEELRGNLPLDGCYINVYDRKAREVHFLALADSRDKGKIQSGFCIRVPAGLESSPSVNFVGDTLIVDDIQKDPFTAQLLKNIVPDVRSFMLLKLEQLGQHFGVICFYSSRCGQYDQKQVEFVKSLQVPFSYLICHTVNLILNNKAREIQAENRRISSELDDSKKKFIDKLLLRTAAIEPLIERCYTVASWDANVLILGETGTGKEVFAEVIQYLSSRSQAAFVKINCAAIPETLFDAEFFGYEKGAFTGAQAAHKGYFEQAHGGTLFLDEIGELPLAAQVRLLRVLQSKTIRRIGSQQEIKVDVRIIAATNRDLHQMIEQGKFRQDLLYRINTITLELPPLRSRRQDIVPLAMFFLKRYQQKYKLPTTSSFSTETLERMSKADWPGNVRELEHFIERTLIEGEKETPKPTSFSVAVSKPTQNSPHFLTYRQEQIRYFTSLLQHCGGKVSGRHSVAEISGMNPATLRSKLRKLGIRFGRTLESDLPTERPVDF